MYKTPKVVSGYKISPDQEISSIAPFITPIGLKLPAALPFESWTALGYALRDLRQSLYWLVGDYLNYGESYYGETYAQMMEVTGLEYSTVSKCKWVSRRVPFERRRPTLSFGHHNLVARFDEKAQEEWLGEAERSRWTREQLRNAILEKKSGSASASAAEIGAKISHEVGVHTRTRQKEAPCRVDADTLDLIGAATTTALDGATRFIDEANAVERMIKNRKLDNETAASLLAAALAITDSIGPLVLVLQSLLKPAE